MNAGAGGRPMTARLPSLDGLRAVSIGLVIGAHATRTYGFPEWMGAAAPFIFDGLLGVRVFFVISGFLITWLLLRELDERGAIDLGAFYKRRLLRIFPVFYLYLATVCLSALWIHRDFSDGEWIAAAAFVRNFLEGGWTLGHLWSIAVEEQFYLFWPLTLVLLKSRRQLVVVAGAVILLAPIARVLVYLSPWRHIPGFGFVTQADSLMVGALLAVVLADRSPMAAAVRRRLENTRRVQVVALAIIYAVWLLTSHGLAGRLTVPFGPTAQHFAIAAFIATVVLVPRGAAFRVLNYPLLAWVGVLSYSLYIWQQLFLYPATYEDGDLWWRTFPANLVLLLLVSCASFYLVEKPFLKLKQRFAVAS